jgi:hypothetical protein
MRNAARALGIAQPVVVDVEAASEPEARVEGKGAHEGARAIAAGVEEGRQGVRALGKR